MQNINKKFVTIVAGAALFASIPTASYAISSAVPGAQAATYSSDKGVKVTDTASDSHRAQVNYKRGSFDATTRSVSATGGTGSTAYSGTSTTKIEFIKACRLNNNPFDSDECDAWRS